MRTLDKRSRNRFLTSSFGLDRAVGRGWRRLPISRAKARFMLCAADDFADADYHKQVEEFSHGRLAQW